MRSALALLLAAVPLAAQTPAAPAHKPATAGTATARTTACIPHPEVTSKVPALPAGAPCAKHLYTITTVPAVKLENISPLEGSWLKETLGLETTSFSLDYIDTKVGAGARAQPHKWYTINYSGYLTDGTKFDSSLEPGREPFTINYAQHTVIPGWDTGFDGMHMGGKRRLFIPYQLAYGTKGNGAIPPKAELIFDVELISQSDTPPPAPPTPPAPPVTPPPAATPPAGGPQAAPQMPTPPPEGKE